METPYSKQDEVIEEGVQALREQAVDTSAMASVLRPKRRSVVLPVGLATAAAVAIGLVVLLTPSKADAAAEFGKVVKAVQNQKAVVEKVLQRGKNQLWEVKLEAWQDGAKKGVKYGPSKGGAEIVLDGKKTYVKKADDENFKVILDEVELVTAKAESAVEVETIEGQVMFAVDLSYIKDANKTTINEILARDGMEFLGIQRNGKKDGRASDIYRVHVNGEKTERLYYVDPKTDLPFLLEMIGPDGTVKDRVEFAFPGEITIELKESQKGLFEVKLDKANLELKEVPAEIRLIEKPVETKK